MYEEDPGDEVGFIVVAISFPRIAGSGNEIVVVDTC
jgi:hypothetical protein